MNSSKPLEPYISLPSSDKLKALILGHQAFGSISKVENESDGNVYIEFKSFEMRKEFISQYHQHVVP